MFRRLRIAILLYVLAFVAVAQFFLTAETKDWDAPLWVDVYAVAGDATRVTQDYVAALGAAEFKAVEEFLAREAGRHGLALDEPFRIRVVGTLADELPEIPAEPGALGVLAWSLRMRWLATRLRWQQDGPSGDIAVFAVFHAPSAAIALDRSTALEKGLIAVAHVFADRDARATNDVVVAHELLHTLGATDKYSPLDNSPRFPDGYAEPDAQPLLPQRRAELMAGRMAISPSHAEMPAGLAEVLIGPVTAREIGW